MIYIRLILKKKKPQVHRNKTNNQPNLQNYFNVMMHAFSGRVKPPKKSTLLHPQAVALMEVSCGKTHCGSCSSSGKDTGSATFTEKLLKSTNISLDVAVCGRCHSVCRNKRTIKGHFCEVGKVAIFMYVVAEDTQKKGLAVHINQLLFVKR